MEPPQSDHAGTDSPGKDKDQGCSGPINSDTAKTYVDYFTVFLFAGHEIGIS